MYHHPDSSIVKYNNHGYAIRGMIFVFMERLLLDFYYIVSAPSAPGNALDFKQIWWSLIPWYQTGTRPSIVNMVSLLQLVHFALCIMHYAAITGFM